MESIEAIYEYAWLVPVLPLVGAALVGTGLISYSQTTSTLKRPAAVFIVSLTGAAMVLSFLIFFSQVQGHETYTRIFEWASAGDFRLTMGYTIDHLASLMLVIVTTVAFLVMIYTDGYMAHDPGYVRFYTYLSLFSSSMLGLVISPNLLQVYVFWELVGMCSYLLIGFWYNRKAAADACQKAFVTNRVGDFGLLLGMLAIFWATGTFEFELMGDRLTELVTAGSLSSGLVAVFAILVFLGPMAKSAQFPLHVWLPDAMEGPTPISALIHAATMVAAGVFLVARMFPVFEELPTGHDRSGLDGSLHRLYGGQHRHHPKRHQKRASLLHHVPVGLHGDGYGGRGLWGRSVPPDDPRLLQSHAVPGLRLCDPWHGRGGGPRPGPGPGHATHGRAAQIYARHRPHLFGGHPGHLRDSRPSRGSGLRMKFWAPPSRLVRCCGQSVG
jgi:hypothetical protein